MLNLNMALTSPLAAIALVCVISVSFQHILTKRRKLPLPPGPRQLPIIGNALSIPTRRIAQVYREMSMKYGACTSYMATLCWVSAYSGLVGDLVYLESFGQPLLVIGTHETALDLLERRSAKYADKVHSTMASL